MSYIIRKQVKLAILFASSIVLGLGNSVIAASIDTEAGTYSQSVFVKAERNPLKERPLAPSNINLFSPVAYPGATPLVPAGGPPPTVGQVRRMLKVYLKEQFPLDEGLQKKGLKLFDSAKVNEKIPNPSLRAAMVGLLGTAGEPSINYILHAKTPEGLPKGNLISFGVPEEWVNGGAIAKAFIDPNTQQQNFVFNPRYQSENPFQFGSVLAHETLHTDLPNSATEETVLLALQTFDLS
jgi:hypothetical protein